MSTLLEERPVTRDPEVTVRVVTEESRRGGGGGRRVGSGNLLTTAGLGAIAVAILLVVGAITGLFDLGGLFESKTIDRSPPVLLNRLRTLSDFRAAQGEFGSRVVLEDDVPVMPSFLFGSTVIFDAVGTVDATIDFGQLSTDAVQVNGDNAVTISLRHPVLQPAVIDARRSEVVDTDRGIGTRVIDLFKDPSSQKELFVKAAKKIDKAAVNSNLITRAERSTTRMLKGFLGRLGFDRVTVNWTEPVSQERAATS